MLGQKLDYLQMTHLHIVFEHPETTALRLNADLQTISDWVSRCVVSFYPSKTESMIISRKINKPIHPPVSMPDCQI